MRPVSPSLPAAAALLGAALFAVATLAQAPQPPVPGGGHPHPPAPKPTNLKVLPKDLTGDQVMEIMHGWEAQLGSECITCHTADPVKKFPNGKPLLNFADDSKKEKETARLMLKMTIDINEKTSMVESSHDNAEAAKKVTCGTCHRGHLDPPAYVPPPKEHEHEHHDGGEKPPAAQ